ncbi:MAG: hypothetical protein J6A17_02170 [Bacilli bacterium]|nr:hypothetical protein [Bacilli bacterium]
MDFDIDKIISEMDFTKNSINNCGNGIYLTNFEIDVLNKYHINYSNCTSMKDIIFLVEEILNEDSSLDDLENISKSISERDYYLNTNK